MITLDLILKLNVLQGGRTRSRRVRAREGALVAECVAEGLARYTRADRTRYRTTRAGRAFSRLAT